MTPNQLRILTAISKKLGVAGVPLGFVRNAREIDASLRGKMISEMREAEPLAQSLTGVASDARIAELEAVIAFAQEFLRSKKRLDNTDRLVLLNFINAALPNQEPKP